MLMKVFSKGQVVIPADVRNSLGIHVGEMLDVSLDASRKCIELKVPVGRTGLLAGSLSKYSAGRKFPGRNTISEAFRKGVAGEKRNN